MQTLEELFTEEIRDLYDAEKQLTKALPKMAKAASSEMLKKAFSEHLEQTKGHVARLEQVFETVGEKPKSKPCHGMKGLIEEGQEHMQEEAPSEMLDSALIGAAQKVEHYEISGYGTARTHAEFIGLKKAVRLLEQTLKEEERTDEKLTQISIKLLKGLAKSSSSGSSERGRASANAATRSRPSGNGASSRRGAATGSNVTSDHNEIRRWAEERGAHPACVKGTGGKSDKGLLRLDFPGYSGSDSLQEISWDEFFQKFDEQSLALLYQDKTARGQKSNFNKIVSRETAASSVSGRSGRSTGR